MITIPITFCMLIAKYLCLLKPFWLRKNNKTSVLLIIIILAMILGVVKIQVWLNDWNNDFFNALSQKETDKLWQLVLWFPALLGIFVLISVNKTWLIKLLTIRWREWLTDYYLNRWFADKNYYFTQIYGEHKNTDNPDQRIAEDILLLISKTLSLSFGFIQSLSMLITFTVILWQSAGTLSFTVGGTEWSIQGYMVYTVVLIVIGGTLFTHKVGLGKLAARIHDHDRWGDILSSGEKQRIALARLILRRPKWIFLDETTSHLEEQEAIRLLRLVREKLPTSGVIMVTHQPGVWNLVDDICDISAVI
ncbi:TPA: ATP-binding cassette domain-containing protein [Escherichia coli]|nr:ATP-binding cassette domain-containing protein [Escherichia coli]